MESLHHKTALVTGAAKRIGRSLALNLAAAGADVAITYNSSQAEAEATAEALRKHHVRALAVECDVRDQGSVQAAVEAVAREFGVTAKLNFLPERNEVKHAYCSHDKVRGFFPQLAPPVALEEGLRRMAAWARTNVR